VPALVAKVRAVLDRAARGGGRAGGGDDARPGATPRVAAWREGSMTLWRFAPAAGAPPATSTAPPAVPATPAAPSAAPPVVLVYSLVNRPSVLDLLPGRSVVGSLRAAGLAVYLADWGEPGRREALMGLDAHLLRLERAVRAACADAGARAASLLGYCLGGTFSLMLAAHAPALVDRTALLATPLVFREGGLLAAWANAPGLAPEALACDARGNVPGTLARELLRWQDPLGQLAKWRTLAARCFERDFVEGFLAQEEWANDAVDIPGRAFADVVRLLYREDRLARGTLEVAGRPLRLETIEGPVLNILADDDRIVPAAASEPVAALVAPRAVVETRRVPGGHIGMTVGRRATATTHAALARFLHRPAGPRPATSPLDPHAGGPRP
jgi:polyhydroxyalkanoate synthase